MAKQVVWFTEGGAGKTGLTLTFDTAFLIADKSAITPTFDEVAGGCYIVEYSGTGHASAVVNCGVDTTDFRRAYVEWNAPAGSVTGAVGSVTGNVGGNVAGSVGSVAGAVGSVTDPVTVGTNNDKTGYALTSDYDAAKSAASQSSVDTVAGYIDTEVAAIKAKTDNLPASPASSGDVSAISSAITALKATLKSWIFKRTNTVTSGKITSYASGDGGDAVTVTVSRNVDGVTTAETPS